MKVPVRRSRFRLSVLGCTVCASLACASAEDERGNVGPANPAAEYCTGLGYTLRPITSPTGGESADCIFPDGSSCTEWAFFRAECGQRYSYCQKNGGTVASVEKVQGTFTTREAICTKGGVQCSEANYFKTKKCP